MTKLFPSTQAKVFDYSTGAKILNALGMCVLLSFPVMPMLARSAFEVDSRGLRPDQFWNSVPNSVLLIVAAIWMVFVYAAGAWIYAHLPILVDESGIKKLFLGRPIRSIAWQDVRSIEKVRRFYTGRMEYICSIDVLTPSTAISFRETIRGYRELAAIITSNAKRTGIPLHFVDQGLDTILKARRTMTRAEYKQVSKKGIVNAIDAI